MRDTDDSFILHGEKGNRISITDGNYHTVIIDHNIKMNKYLIVAFATLVMAQLIKFAIESYKNNKLSEYLTKIMRNFQKNEKRTWLTLTI